MLTVGTSPDVPNSWWLGFCMVFSELLHVFAQQSATEGRGNFRVAWPFKFVAQRVAYDLLASRAGDGMRYSLRKPHVKHDTRDSGRQQALAANNSFPIIDWNFCISSYSLADRCRRHFKCLSWYAQHIIPGIHTYSMQLHSIREVQAVWIKIKLSLAMQFLVRGISLSRQSILLGKDKMSRTQWKSLHPVNWQGVSSVWNTLHLLCLCHPRLALQINKKLHQTSVSRTAATLPWSLH